MRVGDHSRVVLSQHLDQEPSTSLPYDWKQGKGWRGALLGWFVSKGCSISVLFWRWTQLNMTPLSVYRHFLQNSRAAHSHIDTVNLSKDQQWNITASDWICQKLLSPTVKSPSFVYPHPLSTAQADQKRESLFRSFTQNSSRDMQKKWCETKRRTGVLKKEQNEIFLYFYMINR